MHQQAVTSAHNWEDYRSVATIMNDWEVGKVEQNQQQQARCRLDTVELSEKQKFQMSKAVEKAEQNVLTEKAWPKSGASNKMKPDSCPWCILDKTLLCHIQICTGSATQKQPWGL